MQRERRILIASPHKQVNVRVPGRKLVLAGPVKRRVVATTLRFLPFALNSRPFQSKIGYNSYLGCLKVLYHTAFLHVPTQMSPLYQDAPRVKI
ncbi:hypothetical protein N7537_008046 [Penicillium hordei]|uniref:Uncharacterized protein n=1 Tax=Penicillium hordei TaxID=40994 RepID=A0AAD6GZ71_9EURO|nr:uncharacterized protein N7537_008046 [Penicillium hordei]KAJ5597962.1 hypothetical protein N7537_008046 [Penicillium hordei]